MDRDRRMLVDLSDPPEGFRKNPPFGLELFIEAQRGPVATAAFIRDRAGHAPAERTGLEQFHELPASEAFLHFEETHQRFVAGKNIDGEDGETIDARERRATGDKLLRLNG